MGHLEEFTRWPAKRFVETGFGGGLTFSAAVKHYEECITIELDYPRYLDAVEMFEDHPNARIYHGNSAAILPKIIDPNISTVFWLDAHYVHADTVIAEECKSGAVPMCPLLEELALIKSYTWTVPPIILIDDWSTFRTHSEWPDLKQIDDLMGKAHRRYPELPGCDVFGYA